jgi:hypothetical protein
MFLPVLSMNSHYPFSEFNGGNLDNELYITIFYAIIVLDKKTTICSNASFNTSRVFEKILSNAIKYSDKSGQVDIALTAGADKS